jgi:hypothetical protein
MAKTTKAINVSIGASLKELEQAMRDAGILVEDFSVKAKKAGTTGAAGFNDLEKSLKGFRREQVQEGRLVGFYVKELADFTSLSAEAKTMVGGLGQVLLNAATSGISFGLAFEAVKLVVAVISESLAKATKEAEATAAALLKIQSRIDAIGKSKRQVMLEEVSKLSALLREMDASGTTPRRRRCRSTRRPTRRPSRRLPRPRSSYGKNTGARKATPRTRPTSPPR